jgi:hypothetical protein
MGLRLFMVIRDWSLESQVDADQFDVFKNPFIEVDLPDYETAEKIAHRSVMVSLFCLN